MDKYIRHINDHVLKSTPNKIVEPKIWENFPPFLLAGSIEWSSAVLELMQSVEAHSQLGFFQDLQFCWMSIDNTFIMWNPFNGRDIVAFNRFSQMIVAVSDLILPREGIFIESITHIIALASCDVLALIGIQNQMIEDGNTIKLVDLEFTVKLPCIITKICVNNHTKTIYCTGVDGQLYEVVYSASSTFLNPRFYIRPTSSLFSINTLASVMNVVKSIWGQGDPPLVDIVSKENKVFVLSSVGTIYAYKIEHSGLTYLCKALTGLPLISIHLEQIDCVVAVTETGDRHRYTLRCGWSASRLDKDRWQIPTPLPHGCLITHSWYCNGIFICSFIKENANSSSDSVLFVSDLIDGNSTMLIGNVDGLKVEFLCERNAHPYDTANDIFMRPPRQLLLIHRTGIFNIIRLRPIDALHIIIDKPLGMDRHLQDLRTSLDSIWLSTVALQLASRLAFTDSPPTYFKETSIRAKYSKGQLLHDHNLALIINFFTGASSDVSRRATELLKEFTRTSADEQIVGDRKEIKIPLSPFSISVSMILAQIIATLKDTSCFKKTLFGFKVNKIRNIKIAEKNILLLIQFLNQIKDDFWFDVKIQPVYSVDFFKYTAILSINKTDMFTHHDHSVVQSIWIKANIQFAINVSQILNFFILCNKFNLSIIELVLKENNMRFASTNFGKLIENSEEMKALAKTFVSCSVTNSTQFGKSMSKFLKDIERRCPLLFEISDCHEYETKLDFYEIFSGNADPTSIRDVVARASIIAGQMYKHGNLKEIILDLCKLGFYNEAIVLYIKAAAQSYNITDQWENIMNDLTNLLQEIYAYDVETFDKIVGCQSQCGTIWMIELNDARTHLRLLQWLGLKRNNSDLTEKLRQKLLWVQSPQLESFLSANIHELGLVYLHYLRFRLKNYEAAIISCFRLIHDPLLHLPMCERLDARIMFAKEAMECAIAGNNAHRSRAVQIYTTLTLQAKLRNCIISLVNDGVPEDQKDIVDSHLTKVSCDLLTPETIFLFALSYEHYGGISVSLETLDETQTFDPTIIIRLLKRLFLNNDYESLLNILQQYSSRSDFPLCDFIFLAESNAFMEEPDGSIRVPLMLLEAKVDPIHAYAAYHSLLEKRLISYEKCLPDSSLIFSVVVLITNASLPSETRSVFAEETRIALNRVSQQLDTSKKAIIEAKRLLDQITII